VNDINIHFTRAEFADRQQRARERMAELELDGILLFKFEDMYWLSGFDSSIDRDISTGTDTINADTINAGSFKPSQ
jgi:Xaa-Pro aminopeptidase